MTEQQGEFMTEQQGPQGNDVELTEEEILQGAEDEGLLSHDEVEEILEQDQSLDSEPLPDPSPTEEDAETDVKRPTLNGHRQKVKPKFEQPGTNNQSREVIEENEKQ